MLLILPIMLCCSAQKVPYYAHNYAPFFTAVPMFYFLMDNDKLWLMNNWLNVIMLVV